MQARLAPSWISSLNACLAYFKQGLHVSVSTSLPHNEWQKECSHLLTMDRYLGGSHGFRTDTGPTGSYLDFLQVERF